ncbi:MAG: hypothetical protein ACOYO1_15585 [Bacteroidales bacterium]
MKKYIYSFLFAIIITGCSTSSLKNLQKGNYDKAIDKSVKELLKDKTQDDEVQVLSQAYKLANQNDNQKIEQLKLSGQPDIWDQVFTIYDGLQKRQDKVARLSAVINISNIGYQNINYSSEIAGAKSKAAEYYYVHAKNLVEKGDKYAARTAYDELQKVKTYYPNYKDVDNLINTAYNKGTTFVLFKIENNSQSIIPQAFKEELYRTSLEDINQKWTVYDTKPLKDFYYDYFIILNLKLIDISPERQSQNRYTDSKKVDDGWTYKLDNKGNVMKDSSGNDIKIPKFKTIRCEITEIQQTKAVIIAGNMEIINNSTRQLLKTDPVRAEWFFKNAFAKAHGDLNALSPQSSAKLQADPIPFPTNADMIMQAGYILKNTCKDLIRRYNSLLK